MINLINKAGTKMSKKIAIPVTEDMGLNSIVFNHFGSAPLFLVVDSETETIRKIDNSDKVHEHGKCNPLQSFVYDKIDAVVTGGIGSGAINKLKAGGVKVYRSGNCKTVAEVLANFAKLEEINTEQGCNHHGHD